MRRASTTNAAAPTSKRPAKAKLGARIAIDSLDAGRPELTLNGPAAKSPGKLVTFDLWTSDFKKSAWSLTGPMEKKDEGYLGEGNVAVVAGGQKRYVIKNDQLQLLGANGQALLGQFALPEDFPRFSWPMDVAHDSQRNIVTVVTLGGEGFLYRFDAAKGRWLDYHSLNNVDIFSLAYDPVKDRYLAWTADGQLLFISSQGNILFKHDVMGKLEGFGRLYDRSNSRPPRLTLVPKGDDVVLLAMVDGKVENIWWFDAASETALLTYRRTLPRP